MERRSQHVSGRKKAERSQMEKEMEWDEMRRANEVSRREDEEGGGKKREGLNWLRLEALHIGEFWDEKPRSGSSSWKSRERPIESLWWGGD
jgi:hypothetical protein